MASKVRKRGLSEGYLKGCEVPMGEGNVADFKNFSLRELHFRLEFLIITTMGGYHRSIHPAILVARPIT